MSLADQYQLVEVLTYSPSRHYVDLKVLRHRQHCYPRFPVAMARGKHLFPFRTEQLSLSAPMVLHGQLCGRVGRCRDYSKKPTLRGGLFLSSLQHHTVDEYVPVEDLIDLAAATAIT